MKEVKEGQNFLGKWGKSLRMKEYIDTLQEKKRWLSFHQKFANNLESDPIHGLIMQGEDDFCTKTKVFNHFLCVMFLEVSCENCGFLEDLWNWIHYTCCLVFFYIWKSRCIVSISLVPINVMSELSRRYMSLQFCKRQHFVNFFHNSFQLISLKIKVTSS